MARLSSQLKNHIAAFVVVVYEDKYYGIAAATGKIGAFVGTYVFPVIISNAGGETSQGPPGTVFGLVLIAILSGILTITLLPRIGQDVIAAEDDRFRKYLMSKGWDVGLEYRGYEKKVDEDDK
ncbi:hypothetical protein V1527DRAFT_491808 [Lipomyces starkeyi]